jgi:membrane protein implicated in regulation of membrane protease activity
MAKPIAEVFILLALFVPLLLVAWAASGALAAETSLLEMDCKWQASFGVALVLPVIALRRLRLLRAPSRPPSIMA